MCYAALALVTDMDAGAEGGEGVGQEEVFALFRAATSSGSPGCSPPPSGRCPTPDGCTCSTWADGIELTYERAREGPAHRLGGLHRHRVGEVLEADGHEVVRVDLMLPMAHGAAAPPAGTHQLDVRDAARWARPAARRRRGLPPGRGGRRRGAGSATCPTTPATTTSAPRRCSPRCTRPASTGWCWRPRWSSTARAATPAPSTATRPRRRARSTRSRPATSRTTARAAAARWTGRWSTRTPGSTRARRTPPARSPRSTTPSAWVRQADARGGGAALPQRLRPGDAAGHAVLRGGRAVPLLARARGAAAGLRGRRPDARLRARRRRGARQPGRAAGGGRRREPGATPPTTSPPGTRSRSSTSPRWWPRAPAAPIAPEVTGGYRLGDVRHVVASPARAAAELGFTAEVRPEQGLPAFATAPLRD